jgi:hypothetical protein
MVFFAAAVNVLRGATTMSKGLDSKKQAKKEPQKTMKEKRAAKRAKKEAARGFVKVP